MSTMRIITKDEIGRQAMTRVKTHPGRVLRAELEARGLSANRLALAIRVPANRRRQDRTDHVLAKADRSLCY